MRHRARRGRTRPSPSCGAAARARGSLVAFLLALTTGPLRAETLSVDGGQLCYEVRGTGPTVVLVHGGFGDHRMWNAQWDVLSRDFRLVRYDHRGFGCSSAPVKAYSPVADLVRLLDHVGARTAHLVGNSMGGTLVVDFALLHPTRTDRIVVVASGASGFPVPPEAAAKATEVFATAQAKGTKAAAELWLTNPMVAVASRQQSTRDLVRSMVLDNHAVFTMRHWPQEPLEPAAAARLSEIKAPTLVILGGEDIPLVNDLGRSTAKGIAGSRLEVIAGADHLPQMVDAAKVNALLRDFLRGR